MGHFLGCEEYSSTVFDFRPLASMMARKTVALDSSWARDCTSSTAGWLFSRSLCCDQTTSSPASFSGRKMLKKKLWLEFFSDPSQWWDHRPEKVNSRFPDFQHKRSGQSLWLDNRSNPPWVAAKLATMAPGLLQCSWNVRLRRHLKAENYRKTLSLFQEMQQDGMVPDKFTFVLALKACTYLKSLEEGRRVHEQIGERGCEAGIYVATCLVDMYAKCGSIEDAWSVFDTMRERDVVSWNAMIGGYVKSDQGLKAMELFRKMIREGVEPDAVTFVGALNACASVAASEEGRLVHEQIIRKGYESDVYVGNCLVDMYAKCGSIEDAWSVFNKMQGRNVVSWSAMIGGYVKSEQGLRAMELYHQMQQEGVQPNAITFVGVLNACASVAALEEGRRVHEQIIQRGFESDVYLANCLVDMYAKCGSIEDARSVFNKMQEHDVVSWSAMIGGYAMHGHSNEAIELFKRMGKEGVEIDQITFTCLLSACSHGRLVKEGLRYFNSMTLLYKVLPTREHYACMVDLLGRAGRLEEAEELAIMPMERNSSVWMSLLGSCRIYGNIEVAERAAKRFWELDPENASGHVLLSNIYAAAGKWDSSAAIGKERLGKKVRNEPGRTWIELNNTVHSFVIDDREHPQLLQILAELERLSGQMNGAEYILDTRLLLHEDCKGSHSCCHLEKVAIGYGLIITPPGNPLFVKKNLRICPECHAAKVSCKYGRGGLGTLDANQEEIGCSSS